MAISLKFSTFVMLKRILMKYSSQYKPLTLDLFRSSKDDLNKTNHWVILGDNIPWAEVEKTYNSRLGNKYKGAGNKPARMIIGASIIKHKLNLSDEETIEIIQENPYMLYLCGLTEFTDSQERKHKGILKIDATCADAEVRFPVDVDIIHDGCKVVDRYLASLCNALAISPVHSSYKVARSYYIELIKRKKKGRKFVKETISHLLHYLNDLRKITDIFVEYRGSKGLLRPHEQRTLNAIFDMFAQQTYMHENNVHVCANRIVSIFQQPASAGQEYVTLSRT